MRILMVTSELAPLAKVGGLADMAAGLIGYLETSGHEVMAVLPDYGAEDHPSAESYRLTASFGSCELRRAQAGGGEVWRVRSPEHFSGGVVYQGDDRDAERFVLLSAAALEHARHIGFRADVLHAHDWHASAAVVLNRTAPLPGAPPSLLTIHNIGYQGVFAADCLAETPFAEHARPLQIEPDAAAAAGPIVSAASKRKAELNFLRAGILAADALSTVSPTHAAEILTPQYGMGLEGLLQTRRDRLHGILNGADYSLWSPQTDPHLAAPFSAEDLAGKRINRRAVLDAVELALDDDMPLVCMVGRLMGQKGIDRVIEAFPELLAARSFAAVFLGDGEARYVEALRALVAAWPDRLALRVGHHEQLAHRLMAGSDILLMPSRYEPCGLTQLYSMRYGTVPVVRATGGLADTVQHFSPDTGEGTGAVFRDDDKGGLQWGLGEALNWHAQPAAWRRVMRNAMAQDYSWQRQGPRYEELYQNLLTRARRAPPR